MLRLNPNDGRTMALAGGLIGLAAGYMITGRASGIIVGVVTGMVAAPLLTGTQPKDLPKALFGKAS